ncbi:hypothetical protein E2C01_050689 [Portunus trituberculatus]|uniref:Uncharacterized protein n=1 Tax=Portunus trituberculatus TaxID=210409 RepID=A0A5B7GJM5_PORTR|nr:hypothetical protein [Portunus trituberculatus]
MVRKVPHTEEQVMAQHLPLLLPLSQSTKPLHNTNHWYLVCVHADAVLKCRFHPPENVTGKPLNSERAAIQTLNCKKNRSSALARESDEQQNQMYNGTQETQQALTTRCSSTTLTASGSTISPSTRGTRSSPSFLKVMGEVEEEEVAGEKDDDHEEEEEPAANHHCVFTSHDLNKGTDWFQSLCSPPPPPPPPPISLTCGILLFRAGFNSFQIVKY